VLVCFDLTLSYDTQRCQLVWAELDLATKAAFCKQLAEHRPIVDAYNMARTQAGFSMADFAEEALQVRR
jgi:hypothetical protein